MASTRICKVADCDKVTVGQGYCKNHYYRFRKYGDPFAGGTSPGVPQKYMEAEVLPHRGGDCLPWPFARDSNGYGQVRIDGKLHYVARLVCSLVHGEPPTAGHQAAHSCGKGHEGCCNPSHLRWATVRENHLDKKAHGTFNPPPNRWADRQSSA